AIETTFSDTQCLRQILNEVFRVFEAYRNAEQVRRCFRGRPFDRSPVFDEALDAPETGGIAKEADARGDPQCVFTTSSGEKRQHATVGLHLPPGDFVTGMRLENWVMNRLHGGVAFKRSCHRKGICRMAFHPAGQRPEPAQDQPGIERRGYGPHDGARVKHRIEHRVSLPEGQGSHLNVAVSAEVLRCRVKDDLYARFEGTLQHGGGKCAINDAERMSTPGYSGYLGKIDNLHQGVGGAFGPDEPGVPANRNLNVLRIVHTDRG